MDLQVTSNGVTASFNAGVSGIKIEVVQFKLGSAFGYTPVPGGPDTTLRGSTVYTGVPTNFSVISADTCEFMLEVPGNAGTFDFGEVGLFLAGDELFAIGALPGLQRKIAFPGLGWNTIRIRARIQLVGVAAVIQWVVQNITVGVIVELANYSLLDRPDVAPANAYIVHEGNEFGNDAFVTRASDETWDVSTHQYVPVKAGDLTVLAGATGGTMTVSGNVPVGNDFPLGRFLIQPKSGTQKGLVRRVTTISNATLTWTPNFGAPLAPGDQWELLQSTASLVETEGSEMSLFHALAARSI